jgi:glycine/D-amino acid oxidase-like deaminating enzyme
MDDILIIGGGVIGSSIAYHLARDGRAGQVTVIERDATYAEASTPRSLGGVRQQFSLAENVLMSQYGLGVYQNFAEDMAVDGEPAAVDFRQGGYLFPASADGMAVIEANHRLQSSLGSTIELLDLDDLAERFPWLSLDGLAGGAFGPEDGWLDPHGALQGFRRKARSLGVTYVEDEVVAIDQNQSRIEAVRLKSGETRPAGQVINAAGAWSGLVADMVGMTLPIVPSRRQVFFVEIREKLGPAPLVIDGTGVYFRPEGRGYLTGWSNPNEPEGFHFEVDHDYFTNDIWPRLAARVPAFEALKVTQSWACHYDLNSLDENLIIGPWVGGCENFHLACGFSGHGLQQAPAVGRAMAELLLDGRFMTIDLSRMTYQRVIDNNPLYETGIF